MTSREKKRKTEEFNKLLYKAAQEAEMTALLNAVNTPQWQTKNPQK
jgi:hypothetical protein